ncbi:MAG: FkbM family methyltransferase [archaeon]
MQHTLDSYNSGKRYDFMEIDYIGKALKKLKLLPEIRHAKILFSQTGEDAFLREVYLEKKKGFYVDVGAHHPTRYSNTFIFYSMGWRGINIEPQKEAIRLFEKKRPQDTNLNLAVSDKEGEVTFFEAPDNAYSTILPSVAKDFKGIKTSRVKSMPLSKILDQYLPKGTKIDFLSTDTEGNDLTVLKSNNWKKYKPTYVLVEMMEMPEYSKESKKIYDYLKNQGYKFVGKTNLTGIFKLNN